MALAGDERGPEPGVFCLSNAFIVRLAITLDDVTPAVSRVIEVPLGIRLDRLHSVFQAALAWTDSHLWELTVGRTGFGIPDPEYGFGGPLDARKATLGQALEGMRGKTFRYLYDFGDAWEHSVKIQASLRPSSKAAILACSPPPACGRQRNQADLGAMPRSWRPSPIRPMNTMGRRWRPWATTMISMLSPTST